MSAHPFFITGLPRSRTAWMAVACTTPRSVCMHEPGDGGFDQAAQTWGAARYSVGISDSRLGLHLTRILGEIGPKTLIIDRPIDDVVASYARYSGEKPQHVWRAASARLEALQAALAIEHPLIRRVSFDHLNNIDVMRDCLDWLGVKPLNLPQLMHMNIQSDYGFNLARAHALAAA